MKALVEQCSGTNKWRNFEPAEKGSYRRNAINHFAVRKIKEKNSDHPLCLSNNHFQMQHKYRKRHSNFKFSL